MKCYITTTWFSEDFRNSSMISDSPIILTEFTAMKQCESAHSHLFYNSPVFKNWFMLSKRNTAVSNYGWMWEVWRAWEKNKCRLLSALQTSQVHPKLDNYMHFLKYEPIIGSYFKTLFYFTTVWQPSVICDQQWVVQKNKCFYWMFKKHQNCPPWKKMLNVKLAELEIK